MRIDYVKVALMVAWALAICALGYASGTTSVAGWTLVVALALVPPAVMVRLWSAPAASMSESIRDVLR